MNDYDYWYKIDPKCLWVTDKLLLAKNLGYHCGPAGVPPQHESEYIVRPCVNYKMMSRGAYVTTLSPTNYEIPDGFFWCEKFTGRHLSFDYKYGNQVLAVEGFRDNPLRLNRFSMWKKVTDKFELPSMLKNIAYKNEWLNVEVIGNKIIEVHFRYNDDFRNHDSDTIIPVWKEDFYPSSCGDRVGFILK
jgi:hypothetical protein